MKLQYLRPSILFLLTILILLAAGACSPFNPEPVPLDTPTPVDPQAVYTAAVETVVAELTRAAAITPSPLPTDTPAPADTATPEVPATPTPLPTDTPAPTPTPSSPTPTSPPPSPATPSTDPLPTLGAPSLRESFDDASGWTFTSDGHTQMDVRDGQLRMVALNPDFWNGWAFTRATGSDFYLEMTATHQACSGLDRFGLIFRAPTPNSGYLLGLSCDGRYGLWTWDGAVENRFLDWTSSPHIRSGEGETNRLGVLTRGNQITIYANGNLLTQVTHEVYTSGRFGLFIGSAATPNYTVLVDELVFWDFP